MRLRPPLKQMPTPRRISKKLAVRVVTLECLIFRQWAVWWRC